MPPHSEDTVWFSEHVQPHEPALRSYLRSKFPSVDADDVLHDSYIKLLAAKQRGRIASTRAYLFSIARNTAITLFNRTRIYSPTALADLPEENLQTRDSDRAGRERLEVVARAIGALPERCGQVVELAILGRLSNAEIATRLGMSEPTVRVHLARGVKKCAEFLRETGETT
jgi:RNA polymerase sigma-70 factor (ECF subfamily)